MTEVRPTPNHKLRYERERRGWSQQDVADKVGTTPLNVGRWERGVTVPGLHFRVKLSEVFEKSPADFGLMADRPVGSLSSEPSPVQTTATTVTEPSAPLWNVPYGRNIFFTGREEVLDHLQAALSAQAQPIAITQPQAISGLGGIGKTQTAVEYSYRYREHYDAVLWVRADSAELLSSDFLLIATLLNLPQRHEHDQNLMTKAVLRWFNTHERWLLILDNADHLEIVSTFIPMTGKGHVLLTTRAHSTGTMAQRIELDTMKLKEGTFFLLRRAKLLKGFSSSLEAVPDMIRSQAQAIVEALDGLPLALDQAGAYIEETGCSLSDYLKFYQSRRTRLLRLRGQNATGHPESVVTTWSLSFEKVERINPASAELLHLCAFLHPDEIPESMIMEGASELGPVLQPVAEDELDLNEAIGELLRYSLVKRDAEKKILNIHRLVQAVIKDEMSQETQSAWAERMIRMLSHVFPDPRQVEDWPRCQEYMPHVHYCIEVIEQQKMLSPEAAQLLFGAGSFLIEQAHFNDAKRLMQHALAIREQIFGPNYPNVAHVLKDLAWIYFSLREGTAKQVEFLYQRAIAIYEQAFGPNYPEVAKCYSDLAVLYGYQGKYEKAEKLLQQALAIREQLFGPDHIDVAESLYHLSVISFYQENYKQAEQLLERALLICKGASGNHTHHESGCLGFLALVHQEQGKYQQAESCLQQSLSIYKQVFGDDHYWTPLAIGRLGVLYREQGKHELSESLLLQALDIHERNIVSNITDKGSVMKELALLYYRQGKYEQAEHLLQRTLACLQHELDTHIRAQEQWPTFFSEVVECLNTLALLYQDQGRKEVAEQYHQRALALMQQGWNSNDMLKMKREREAQTFETRTHVIRAE